MLLKQDNVAMFVTTVIASFLGFFAGIQPACSPKPELTTRQKAEHVIRHDRAFAQKMASFSAMYEDKRNYFRSMLINAELAPEDKDRFLLRLDKIIQPMTMDSTVSNLANIYLDVFTPDEINAMYRRKTSESTIHKMPVFTSRREAYISTTSHQIMTATRKLDEDIKAAYYKHNNTGKKKEPESP